MTFLNGPMMFLIFWAACSGTCVAEDLGRGLAITNNVDYSIFSDSERRFLSSQTPLFKTSSVVPRKVVSNHYETEITLREIELRKFESETEEEFIERANSLHADLIEHPENFQEKARSLSASRSRFRAGLLTPLTVNQLDPELGAAVVKLESSQVTEPIKIGSSIFILRREAARSITKPDQ